MNKPRNEKSLAGGMIALRKRRFETKGESADRGRTAPICEVFLDAQRHIPSPSLA
jgi:hypothetical protein